MTSTSIQPDYTENSTIRLYDDSHTESERISLEALNQTEDHRATQQQTVANLLLSEKRNVATCQDTDSLCAIETMTQLQDLRKMECPSAHERLETFHIAPRSPSMAIDLSITLADEQTHDFQNLDSNFSKDDVFLPHLDDLFPINSPLFDPFSGPDYLDHPGQVQYNPCHRKVLEKTLSPPRDLDSRISHQKSTPLTPSTEEVIRPLNPPRRRRSFSEVAIITLSQKGVTTYRSVSSKVELPNRARSLPCESLRDLVSQDRPFIRNNVGAQKLPCVALRDLHDENQPFETNTTKKALSSVFSNKSRDLNKVDGVDFNKVSANENSQTSATSYQDSLNNATKKPATRRRITQDPDSERQVREAKDESPVTRKLRPRRAKMIESPSLKLHSGQEHIDIGEESPSERFLRGKTKRRAKTPKQPSLVEASDQISIRLKKLSPSERAKRGWTTRRTKALNEAVISSPQAKAPQSINHTRRLSPDQSSDKPSAFPASEDLDTETRTTQSPFLPLYLETHSKGDSHQARSYDVDVNTSIPTILEPTIPLTGPRNPFTSPLVARKLPLTPPSSGHDFSWHLSPLSERSSEVGKCLEPNTPVLKSSNLYQPYLSPSTILPTAPPSTRIENISDTVNNDEYIYEDHGAYRRFSTRSRKAPEFYINAASAKRPIPESLPAEGPQPESQLPNVSTTTDTLEKRKRRAAKLPSGESNSRAKRTKLSDPSSSIAAATDLSTLPESQDKIVDHPVTYDDQDETVYSKEDTHDAGFTPAMLDSEVGESSRTVLQAANLTATPKKLRLRKPLDKAITPSTVRKEASVRKRQTPAKPKPIDSDSRPSRPKPYGSPLVWAADRQALCESLPYYRAYQSGAYTRDGLAHGFLLDRDCGDRPYMDEEVVITRAGGGCSKNEEGRMEQIKDHSSDSSSIKSFQKNLTCRVPLVLIVGKDNDSCPVEILHQYCVMGWFHVTNIWAEKINGRTAFKYRFEKIDLINKSWWAPAGSLSPAIPLIHPPQAPRTVCAICKETFPEMFTQGWTCLNTKCAAFWMMDGADPPADLTYSTRFLKERNPWPKEIKPPHDLNPGLLEPSAGDDPAYVFCRAAWKGMACPKCGRCSSKRPWDAWQCGNPECGFSYKLKQPILTPRQVSSGHSVEFTGHALPMDDCSKHLHERPTKFIGDWRISTYDLIAGNSVTHFQANKTINTAKGGAHELFMSLQTDNCMGLQRFPKQQGSLKGETLANHFSMNWGMPYKYFVKSDSRSFADAPLGIIRGLRILTWAGRVVAEDGSAEEEPYLPPNECLAVGYFEEGKMGYHDDGEKELGPTIATYTLGGSAKMTLRMKTRYYTGLTGSGTYNPLEPILPGCRLETERRELNALYGQISNEEFDSKRIEMYRSAKAKRISETSPVLLSMELAHGDIVVMHGAEMQKYYEHKVVSSDMMRFALTCRYIRPELVDPSEHHKGVFDSSLVDDYHGGVGETEATAMAEDMTLPQDTSAEQGSAMSQAIAVELESVSSEAAIQMQGLALEPAVVAVLSTSIASDINMLDAPTE